MQSFRAPSHPKSKRRPSAPPSPSSIFIQLPNPFPEWHLGNIIERDVLVALLSMIKPFIEIIDECEKAWIKTDITDTEEYKQYLRSLRTFYKDHTPYGDEHSFLRESDHQYFVHDEVDDHWHRVLYTSTTSLYKLLKKDSFDKLKQMDIMVDVYTPFIAAVSAPLPDAKRTKVEKSEDEVVEEEIARLSETGRKRLAGSAHKYHVSEQVVMKQWQTTRNRGTLFHSIMEKLYKKLALSEQEREEMNSPTWKQLIRFMTPDTDYAVSRYYQGETTVCSRFELKEDDSIRCLRCTGQIDLVYARGGQDGIIFVTIGDAKFSNYDKNQESGDPPKDELKTLFGFGGKKHDWYTIQVAWYKFLYEAQYPKHKVVDTFLVYFDQGATQLEKDKAEKDGVSVVRPMQTEVVQPTQYNPILVAYLQYTRLCELARLATEDAGRLQEALLTNDITVLQRPPNPTKQKEHQDAFMHFHQLITDHRIPQKFALKANQFHKSKDTQASIERLTKHNVSKPKPRKSYVRRPKSTARSAAEVQEEVNSDFARLE